MLDHLLAVAGHFDELATSLIAMKELYPGEPAAIERLEAAHSKARRGAELTRSHIEALERKPNSDEARRDNSG